MANFCTKFYILFSKAEYFSSTRNNNFHFKKSIIFWERAKFLVNLLRIIHKNISIQYFENNSVMAAIFTYLQSFDGPLCVASDPFLIEETF